MKYLLSIGLFIALLSCTTTTSIEKSTKENINIHLFLFLRWLGKEYKKGVTRKLLQYFDKSVLCHNWYENIFLVWHFIYVIRT